MWWTTRRRRRRPRPQAHALFQKRRIDGYTRIDDQFHLPHLALRRQRQFRLSVAANQVGHAERDIGQANRLQMRDFAQSCTSRLQAGHHVQQQRIDRERLLTTNCHRRIEQTQFRLALGIGVIVDVENLAAEMAVLVE